MNAPLTYTFVQWVVIFIIIVMIALLGSIFYVGITILNSHRGPSLVVIADPDQTGEYVTDGNYIYFNNAVIVGADVKSFKTYSESYSSDKNHVYYGGQIMTGADVSSFEIAGNSGYVKDKNAVYYSGKKISDDSLNFNVFALGAIQQNDNSYAKDKLNVYYGGLVLQGADPATFTLLENYYSKDKSTVYFDGQIVQGADAKTFVAVETDQNCVEGTSNPCFDAKDKNYKYYTGQPI